ncbi:MAG: hypothetical protein KDI09_21010 [Halioglobus sp.]|nr:hypothetical protein [Halioglobus sp.]
MADSTRRGGIALNHRLLAQAIVILIAFLGGGFLATLVGGDEPVGQLRSQRANEQLQQQLDSALGRLEMLRTRREVDQRALEMVRSELAVQKEHIAELEEGLRFYRSLIAPEGAGGGLSLREPELLATEEAGRYLLRLVVQQVARKHEKVEGSLEVTLTGNLGGETVSLALPELSEDFVGPALKLRFRYFQLLEGELVLPAGFEPQSVNIVARANSPRAMDIQKEFPWHLQERFTHVGQ